MSLRNNKTLQPKTKRMVRVRLLMYVYIFIFHLFFFFIIFLCFTIALLFELDNVLSRLSCLCYKMRQCPGQSKKHVIFAVSRFVALMCTVVCLARLLLKIRWKKFPTDETKSRNSCSQWNYKYLD